MQTNLTRLLGVEHPIISAPMGPDITGAELVAAVANAGGFGLLHAQFAPPDDFRGEIRRLRDLTDKPFGVHFLLHFPMEELLTVCLEERVPAVSFFWGDPSPYIDRVHEAGALVIHQVGSVDSAKHAADAGVDVIIAQGIEAGGHVAGTTPTLKLVPQVVEAVAPTPVAAAGGIGNARGVAAVLSLGAQAAVLGTRFLATEESHAHPEYKQKLLDATAEDTVVTTLFGHGWPDAPHRTLRTPFVEKWLGNEQRGQESRADEPIVGHTVFAGREVAVQRFMGRPPNADSTGDIELRNLLAGQSVSDIHEIKPAAEVVRELADGARAILQKEGASTG